MLEASRELQMDYGRFLRSILLRKPFQSWEMLKQVVLWEVVTGFSCQIDTEAEGSPFDWLSLDFCHTNNCIPWDHKIPILVLGHQIFEIPKCLPIYLGEAHSSGTHWVLETKEWAKGLVRNPSEQAKPSELNRLSLFVVQTKLWIIKIQVETKVPR